MAVYKLSLSLHLGFLLSPPILRKAGVFPLVTDLYLASPAMSKDLHSAVWSPTAGICLWDSDGNGDVLWEVAPVLCRPNVLVVPHAAVSKHWMQRYWRHWVIRPAVIQLLSRTSIWNRICVPGGRSYCIHRVKWRHGNLWPLCCGATQHTVCVWSEVVKICRVIQIKLNQLV